MVKRCGKLKRDDPDAKSIEHRQAKYLNNRIEADHGPIKRLCRATLGFKSMKNSLCDDQGLRGDADDPQVAVHPERTRGYRRSAFR
jgi:hypothetical protein